MEMTADVTRANMQHNPSVVVFQACDGQKTAGNSLLRISTPLGRSMVVNGEEGGDTGTCEDRIPVMIVELEGIVDSW